MVGCELIKNSKRRFMKKSLILGLFVVLALASCKNQAEAPAAEAPATEAPAAEAPAADTTAAAVDTTAQQ